MKKKNIYVDIKEVVKSGNGAVVYVPKKFIGRKAKISVDGD